MELQKGKKYEIQIGQNTGFAKYAIQIHIPNKVYTINNNVISGSISYIDQQNVYYYTPKRTGTYGFSFGINNAENSYRISLFDSKNEVIFDTYSSNECKEVELKALLIWPSKEKEEPVIISPLHIKKESKV